MSQLDERHATVGNTFKAGGRRFLYQPEYRDYAAKINLKGLAISVRRGTTRYSFWWDGEVAPHHIQASSYPEAAEKILADPWVIKKIKESRIGDSK